MPQLKIITSLTTRCLDLTEDYYLCGRSDDCDIVIGDAFVSRHHFTLFRPSRADYYRIADGNIETGITSRNGVRVNGRVLSYLASLPLYDTDIITISPTVSIVYLSDEFNEETDNDTAAHEFAVA